MKRRFQKKNGFKDNRGAALLTVLAVVSVTAALCFVSLGTSALLWRIQSLGKKKDENFYLAEMALDEIYCGLDRDVGEAIGTGYGEALYNLYTAYQTNDEANEGFREGCIEALEEILGVSLENGEGQKEKLAERLKEYVLSVEGDSLTVEIGSVVLKGGKDEKSGWEIRMAGEKQEENGFQVVLKDTGVAYVNPETEEKSVITVDLTVQIPTISFIDEELTATDSETEEGDYEIAEYEDFLFMRNWQRGKRAYEQQRNEFD